MCAAAARFCRSNQLSGCGVTSWAAAKPSSHSAALAQLTSREAAEGPQIAASVISGRKTGAEMARLYNISPPTVSCIVGRTAPASRSSGRPAMVIDIDLCFNLTLTRP